MRPYGPGAFATAEYRKPEGKKKDMQPKFLPGGGWETWEV